MVGTKKTTKSTAKHNCYKVRNKTRQNKTTKFKTTFMKREKKPDRSPLRIWKLLFENNFESIQSRSEKKIDKLTSKIWKIIENYKREKDVPTTLSCVPARQYLPFGWWELNGLERKRERETIRDHQWLRTVEPTCRKTSQLVTISDCGRLDLLKAIDL